MKEKLNLDEKHRTPQIGESLAEFYTRTSEHWTKQAAMAVAGVESDTNEVLTEKEMKREGFALAQRRYSELEPLLKELDMLDQQQRDAEEDRKTKKQKKKKKEKSERKRR